MGLFDFARSLVDRQFLGKEIIRKQIEVYYQQRKMYPDQCQHIHLAQTWLSRQSARGANINSQEIQSMSYEETLLIACIPHPRCAEALGLFVLYDESPDIPRAYPEFAQSYLNLLSPVMESKKQGNLKQLYRKHNSNMSEENVNMLFDE